MTPLRSTRLSPFIHPSRDPAVRPILCALSLWLFACDGGAATVTSEGTSTTADASDETVGMPATTLTTLPSSTTATTMVPEPETSTGEAPQPETEDGTTTGGPDSAEETTADRMETESQGGGRTTEDPVRPACGNGIVEDGEACDGEGESEACNADCTVAACGDGIVNAAAGETCDEGEPSASDFCRACLVAPDIGLAGVHTFDTDSGALDGVVSDGWDPETSTLFLSAFEIEADAVLSVSGSQAFRVEVDGDVEIAGTIEAFGADGGVPGLDSPDCSTAAAGGAGGPGGFAGGAGGGIGGTETEDGAPGEAPPFGFAAQGGMASTATSGIWAGAGGGGGGHSVPGLPGSQHDDSATVGGVGGGAHTSLPPLVGGGGGGGGSVEKDGDPGVGIDPADDEGGGGGGGGGVVWLRATVSVVVSGTIDASGGDGGSDGACSEERGGGGGGAGGAIRLSAPEVDAVAGLLNVDGGLGGVSDADAEIAAVLSGGDGAPGRVLLHPVGFSDCIPGTPGACGDGAACLVDAEEDPTFAVCTFSGCEVVADCPPAPTTGTATAVCEDINFSGANDCVLSCAAAETCPDGMVCNALAFCAFAVPEVMEDE